MLNEIPVKIASDSNPTVDFFSLENDSDFISTSVTLPDDIDFLRPVFLGSLPVAPLLDLDFVGPCLSPLSDANFSSSHVFLGINPMTDPPANSAKLTSNEEYSKTLMVKPVRWFGDTKSLYEDTCVTPSACLAQISGSIWRDIPRLIDVFSFTPVFSLIKETPKAHSAMMTFCAPTPATKMVCFPKKKQLSMPHPKPLEPATAPIFLASPSLNHPPSEPMENGWNCRKTQSLQKPGKASVATLHPFRTQCLNSTVSYWKESPRIVDPVYIWDPGGPLPSVSALTPVVPQSNLLAPDVLDATSVAAFFHAWHGDSSNTAKLSKLFNTELLSPMPADILPMTSDSSVQQLKVGRITLRVGGEQF